MTVLRANETESTDFMDTVRRVAAFLFASDRPRKEPAAALPRDAGDIRSDFMRDLRHETSHLRPLRRRDSGGPACNERALRFG